MATGHLGSFTFGTNAISLNIIEIQPNEESVEDIAEPHLGLAIGAYIPYSASELIEGGEYTLILADDNDTNITVRVTQTCTWTKPPVPSKPNGATHVFPGYIKAAKSSTQKTGERNTIEVKVKVAGNVTKTAASSGG
jgi:hypothetical protein